MNQFIALVTVGMFASVGSADQPPAWPQFRGPNGSGIAEGQKPPVEFGPDKNVKWKVPVPSGLSSPVVAGDKLVITAFEGDKLYHDRVQPGGWERGLAGGSAGQAD